MKKIITLFCALLLGMTLQAQTTIASWDFAESHMTGITYGLSARVTSSDVWGPEASNIEAQTNASLYWARISDSATFVSSTYASNYPNSYNFSPSFGGMVAAYMGSAYTGNDNGFMFLSMIEAGFNPGGGTYVNAYISFPAVARPTTTQVVDVEWDQAYRKYYDQCFVDYKINGAWNSMEVNVTGIDIEINSWGVQHCRYTMPLALASESNIELRLRYYGDGMYQVYGYFWAVDNFTVKEGNPSSWTVGTETYVDGAYGRLPQGFQIPLTWYNTVRNTGAVTQTGVNAAIKHFSPSGTESTGITEAQSNIAPSTDYVPVTIDGRGFYDNSGSHYYQGWFFDRPNYGQTNITTTNNGLPTTEAGIHKVWSELSSNDTSITWTGAVHNYTVTTADSDGAYLWGYGNGVLAGGTSGFRMGYVENGPYITSEGGYNIANYELLARFTTPNVIQVDTDGNPWVLRGIEMVVDPTCNAVGADITPILYASLPDGEGGYNYYNIATGVTSHTVTADEVTPLSTGYLLPGNYNTLRILFPQQLELAPNVSYLLGYHLNNNADFAVAGSSNRYVSSYEDGTYYYTYYQDDSALVDYVGDFKPGAYDLWVYDQRGDNGSGRGFYISNFSGYLTPMMSALVGPRVEYPTNTVTVECDGNPGGVVQGGDYVCGDSVNLTQGLDYLFYFYADEGYQVDSIFIDGVNVPLDDTSLYTYEYWSELDEYGQSYDAFITPYYGYVFVSLNADHTLRMVSSQVATTHSISINAPTGTEVSSLTFSNYGYVMFSGNSRNFYSDTVTLRFLPPAGTAVNNLLVDGDTVPMAASGNGYFYYTLIMNGMNHYITVLVETLMPHTITITNNGGGYLWDYNNDTGLITGTATYTGYTGTTQQLQLVTFTPGVASNYGFTSSNCRLWHIYVDSVELSLTTNSNMLTIDDYIDNYGIIIYTLTVPFDTNHTVEAWYGPYEQSYTVTTESNNGTLGTVYGGGIYTDGSTAELIALAQPGAAFSGWSNGGVVNPLMLTVTSDTTVTAYFTSADSSVIHDTVINTEYVHDTVINTEYIHDTLINTEYVHDTLVNTEYVHDTLINTEYVYDTLVNTEYVHDTVWMLSDTIYITVHDTVYIYDTVYMNPEGVDDIETLNIRLYQSNGQIVVEGSEGREVSLFDVSGRLMATKYDNYTALRFDVPVSGAYLIKIGELAARRVIVIK